MMPTLPWRGPAGKIVQATIAGRGAEAHWGRPRRRAAINGQDSLDKLPEGFALAIGAKVPVPSKLPEHPLPRPLVYAIPALKNYYYVQLDDTVLIVDPMTNNVAEIVKR
jgi:hypothetical protein